MVLQTAFRSMAPFVDILTSYAPDRRVRARRSGRIIVTLLTTLQLVVVTTLRAQPVADDIDALTAGLARQFRQALLAERKLADDRELTIVRGYESRIRQYRDSLSHVQGSAARTLETALTAVRADRDRYVDSLARRLSQTDAERRALEREVRGLVATDDPARRAALARFADGDRVGAMPVLKEITKVQAAMRERVASLQTAAAYRQDGELLRTMHRLGEVRAAAVLAQYDTVAMYDPEDVETQLLRVRYARAVRDLTAAEEAASAALRLSTEARDSARALDYLGEIAFFRDDLATARAHLEASLGIKERLAANAGADAAAQYTVLNDLAVSYSQLGQLYLVIGDHDKALSQYEASYSIDQRLVASYPSNATLQSNLATSLEQLGDLASFRDELPAARSRYTASLVIRERLAAAEPSSRERKRSLGFALYKVGDAARRAKDYEEARIRLAACFAIRERLAAEDATDVEAQRNLLFSSNALGRLALETRDYTEGRARFTASVAIARRLADSDVTSAVAQRDLGMTLINLAETAIATLGIAEARVLLSESHAIFERRAADPNNVNAQRDLYVSLLALGNLAVAAGDHRDARARYASGHAISERLLLIDSSSTAFLGMVSESNYLLAKAEFSLAVASSLENEVEALTLLRSALARAQALQSRNPEREEFVALIRDIEARLKLPSAH